MKRRARSKLPAGYSAPPGSAREKAIKRAAKLYKQGNKQAAFKLREEMEKKERAKKTFKTKKSKYSKKETSKAKGKRNGNAKKKGRKK